MRGPHGSLIMIGLLLSSLLVLAQVLLPFISFAHVGPPLSGWAPAPPTIDGIVGATEWTTAARVAYTTTGGISGVFYVMNDAVNLYIAVTTTDPTLSKDTTVNDKVILYFDNNHNGLGPESGDDILCWDGYMSEGFRDSFSTGDYGFWRKDTDFGGTSDGLAAATNNGTHNHFEIMHPLNTADNAHDFSLSMGDTVGFGLRLCVDGYDRGWWPSSSPSAWRDIVISSGTIYIRADGSIDPPTAPILRNRDLYTLTGNLNTGADGIVIQRNNMTLDGAGYTVQGIGAVYSKGIYLTSRSNVTIKNINVKGFHFGFVLIASSYSAILRNIIASNSYGIWLNSSSNYNTIRENKITATVQTGISLYDSSNCSIAGNGITNNWGGIGLFVSSKCSVVGNNITSNQWGISFSVSSNNNTIFHNNFVSNTKQVWPPAAYSPKNVWDAGYPFGGNYWSNYNGTDLFRGVYQNETGSDGIGDTKYIIDANNRDNYPLMGPFGPLTKTGTNVTVFPAADVSVTFEHITTEGSTTVDKTATGPAPPPGGKWRGVYYDIKTTATYSTRITIRIIYDDSGLTPQEEASLQLVYWNATGARSVGDISGPNGWPDGIVDIDDVIPIALAYASIKGTGGNYWHSPPCKNCPHNPNCDLTNDGIIDIDDVIIPALHFGQTKINWVNITTLIDTGNNLIYGETSHLSIFGIH